MDTFITSENVEIVTLSLLAIGFIILFGGLYFIIKRNN